MVDEIEMEHAFHNNEMRLLLKFKYDTEAISTIKTLPGVRWSHSLKAWHVAYKAEVADGIINLLAIKGIKVNYINRFDTTALIVKPQGKLELFLTGEVSSHNRQLLDHLRVWMNSRRYSKSSIHSYLDCLELFSRWNSNLNFESVSATDVLRFNNEYILKKGLSATYQSHFISALKLLFNVCRFKTLEPQELLRPKKPKRLPNVLGKEEVKKILDSGTNLKHKAMLSLIYSCGLRCGELLNLKPEHTDTSRNLLIIKQAKGCKDRVVPLSNKIIDLLREYYKVYRPKVYLFEGVKAGTAYDVRSLQNVLKQHVARAGIGKPVTLHWLRHSYATHLLEGGTNLRYIQEILGHSSPKTTQIYTHVSTNSIQKVISPFDSL